MLFLFQINRKTEDGTHSIKNEYCHLIQKGFLFEFIKYPLFRFKCNCDNSDRKWLNWTHIIEINFEVNPYFKQRSVELWQIRLYSIYPDCGEPEKIFNSIENITSPKIAANESYWVKCKLGFELFGKEELKCLGFGNWDYDFPKCELSNKACLIPNISSNLPLIIDDTQKFEFEDKFYALEDSKITFSCNESKNIRYKLIGDERNICKDGKWSQNMPKCIEVNSIYSDFCKPEKILNSIENINSPKIAANESYWVKCKPGFDLFGKEKLKCLGFGNWDYDFPKCELSNKACLIPDISSNLSLIIDDTQNFQFEDKFYALEDSKITFSCNESENIRYKLIGDKQNTCKDGKWSQNMPKCIEVKPCNIPETSGSLKLNVSKLLTFNNNNITNIMADDQSYATYYCDNEEQILKGTPMRRCINGLWDPDSDPICENKQNVVLVIYNYIKQNIIIVILIFLILVLIIAIVVIIRNKRKIDFPSSIFDDNHKENVNDNYDDVFPNFEIDEYSEVQDTKRDEYSEVFVDYYERINYNDLSQTNDCNENRTYLEIT